MLSSHIHTGRIQAPVSNEVLDLDLVMLFTIGISPIYNQNPGYTTIDLMPITNYSDPNNSTIAFNVQEMTYHFFDQTFYQLFGGKKWFYYNTAKEFGINLNKADSIREWHQSMMTNYQLFAKYTGICYGYNWFALKVN